jgi:hypothetical protein
MACARIPKMVIPYQSGARDRVIRLSILSERTKGVWHVEE